jgi:type I thyroxine 5'-deiodinase
VYIQEAHPTDLWTTKSNVKDGVLFASARTEAERGTTASTCVRNLGIRIPAVLDSIENSTERAYTGWPDRLYLVGTDGRVEFKTGPGPYGFSTKGLEQALKRVTGPRVTARRARPESSKPSCQNSYASGS